jgi:hypothetical protein
MICFILKWAQDGPGTTQLEGKFSMNRMKNPTLMLLAAMAALGCSDTLGE